MMSEVIRDNGSSAFKKNFFYSLVERHRNLASLGLCEIIRVDKLKKKRFICYYQLITEADIEE